MNMNAAQVLTRHRHTRRPAQAPPAGPAQANCTYAQAGNRPTPRLMNAALIKAHCTRHLASSSSASRAEPGTPRVFSSLRLFFIVGCLVLLSYIACVSVNVP